MQRWGKHRALETEEGGAGQGQSGRLSPASAPSSTQTKAPAEGMVQPASLSQEATSCGAKSTGCPETRVQTQLCH